MVVMITLMKKSSPIPNRIATASGGTSTLSRNINPANPCLGAGRLCEQHHVQFAPVPGQAQKRHGGGVEVCTKQPPRVAGSV